MLLLKIFSEAFAKRSAELIVGSSSATWIATVAFTWLSGYNITINLPLLGMSFLALLIASVVWMLQRRKKPMWMKYTDDSFEGVKWRWQYSKEREVINLTARCPRCTAELDLQECLSRHGVRYLCNKCVADRWASITATQPKYVDEFVLQLIDGKLYDIKRGAIPIPGFPGS